MSNVTFKFRIYPTTRQVTVLESTLALCQEIYNAAVQERRDAWRINRESVDFAGQSAQLPDIKEARPEFNGIYSQVLQDTLHRVDKTFKGFFRRVKRGDKARRATAGFPRFRSRARYDSFTYPQSGFSLTDGKLTCSKIGKVRIKLHRPVEGKIKTLTIKREAGRWYACFSVVCEPKPEPFCAESVGVDVGVTHFATLSDGTKIDNPRYFACAQKTLRKAQRKVARRKRGSDRRRKAVQLLQRAHAHVSNQRSDFHHKEARKLITAHGLVVVEDLNVKGMASGMRASSVTDAGWSAFIAKLSYKAENALAAVGAC